MAVKINIEVVSENGAFAVEDLLGILQRLQPASTDTGQITGTTATGGEVRAADPLDGATAKENALVLLRKHYEDPKLRPLFKPLLAEFKVKAFGEITPDKGVSFFARVAQILRDNGVDG